VANYPNYLYEITKPQIHSFKIDSFLSIFKKLIESQRKINEQSEKEKAIEGKASHKKMPYMNYNKDFSFDGFLVRKNIENHSSIMLKSIYYYE